jgi:hypothetical protein
MIEGFVGLKSSVSRLETMDSFGAGKYSLGDGSGTTSCGPVALNDPS